MTRQLFSSLILLVALCFVGAVSAADDSVATQPTFLDFKVIMPLADDKEPEFSGKDLVEIANLVISSRLFSAYCNDETFSVTHASLIDVHLDAQKVLLGTANEKIFEITNCFFLTFGDKENRYQVPLITHGKSYSFRQADRCVLLPESTLITEEKETTSEHK